MKKCCWNCRFLIYSIFIDKKHCDFKIHARCIHGMVLSNHRLIDFCCSEHKKRRGYLNTRLETPSGLVLKLNDVISFSASGTQYVAEFKSATLAKIDVNLLFIGKYKLNQNEEDTMYSFRINEIDWPTLKKIK